MQRKKPEESERSRNRRLEKKRQEGIAYATRYWNQYRERVKAEQVKSSEAAP